MNKNTFSAQLMLYMTIIAYFSLLLCCFLLLAGCAPLNSWTHSTKTLSDFKIDQRICHNAALQKSHAASLVTQPIPGVYQTSFNSCMQAMGWNKASDQARIEIIPFTVFNNGTRLHLDGDIAAFDLAGNYSIIRQDENGLMVRERNGSFLQLLLQQSETNFLRIAPPTNANAVLFAHKKNKCSWSTFFYQRVNNNLIFACTSYIFLSHNRRMLVTFSHDMGTINSAFIDIPIDQFTALTTLQDNWQLQINNLMQQ